ncbi:MAG: hypothetical protein JWQ61_1986 [Collimonas fungivorans]|uniref:hypothetical protein n=1 Tax=Collimonas fungivorans TaxID=158899 RepID=UPI0026EDE11C|nr:hypothetical protein [Collimonas fungivorans]MDB5767172.1 hypothetical protein [Collimonas fungivorans]
MKSSAILASISVLILAACGGGGGGSDGGSPPAPVPPPPAASNAIQKQLDSGIYFFGLWQISMAPTFASYIAKYSNLGQGPIFVTTTSYAGKLPGDLTPGLFSYIPWELGSQSWRSATPLATILYGINDTATIPLSTPDSNMPNAKWNLTIETKDVSGTPINKYLQSLPLVDPPAAAGVFGANAKLVSLTYTAADTLVASYSGAELQDSKSTAVTDMNGLLDTTSCLVGDGGKSMMLRYQSNGVINIYDTSSDPSNDKCTFNPATSLQTAVANFVQKSYGPHSYLEITFPPFIDASSYARLRPLFINPGALEAGAKFAIVQRTTGNKNWSYGFVLPKGLQMKDPTPYLNLEAAASLKSALNLP